LGNNIEYSEGKRLEERTYATLNGIGSLASDRALTLDMSRSIIEPAVNSCLFASGIGSCGIRWASGRFDFGCLRVTSLGAGFDNASRLTRRRGLDKVSIAGKVKSSKLKSEAMNNLLRRFELKRGHMGLA